MGQLSGKIALATGGAKSIGRAFPGALAAEGAPTIIADIAPGDAAVEELTSRPGTRAISVPTDVSDEYAVERLVAAGIDAFGRIDILVNIAACFATMPLLPFDEIDTGL